MPLPPAYQSSGDGGASAGTHAQLLGEVKDALAVADVGADILEAVRAFVGRFVAYPSDHAHTAHTLWIAHAHLMDAWDSTPRLAFLSPEKGSGKTRALEVTEPLIPRPILAVNATPAYLFRKVADQAGAPTLLYDEIDTLFGPKAKDNEEVRGMLNAGHRRGAVAGRCAVKGKTIETEELPAYCAVALAGLGELPDTILSRSVVIRMRRRGPDEIVEPYRQRTEAPRAQAIHDSLAAWCEQARASVTGTYPDLPDGITDRDADVWEALIAVADAAGGDWPERARAAALYLVAESHDSTPSLGMLLLADLRTIFAGRHSMTTEQALAALHHLEESPWNDLRGKPLDPRGLAGRLRPYGVRSVKVRADGGKPQQGFRREDLHDVWTRYLPAAIVPDVPDVPDLLVATPTPNVPLNTRSPSNPTKNREKKESDSAALVGVATYRSGTSGTSGTSPQNGADRLPPGDGRSLPSSPVMRPGSSTVARATVAHFRSLKTRSLDSEIDRLIALSKTPTDFSGLER